MPGFDLKGHIPQRLELALQRRRICQFQATGSQAIGRPLVVGLLSTSSGLGNGGRLILNGLQQAGYEPSYLDVTGQFPGHESTIDLSDCLADDGHGPVIVHLNPIEFAHLLDISAIANIQNRYRVGIWAWEQKKLPATWRSFLPWVDEIWGSSTFLAELFSKETNKPSYYVRYPCGLMDHPSEQSLPQSEGQKPDFKVLTAFSSLSSIERKNPAGAVKAFLKAFPEQVDVSMTVHASSYLSPRQREALQYDDRVKVVDKPLSDENLTTLFRSHDAFLSLHRAEGFGLSIAKALALGIFAIFTDHSGARDFTASPMAYGVRCRPASVSYGNPHYRRRYGRWAEPDLDQAADILKHLRSFSPYDRAALSTQSVKWWQTHYGHHDFARRIAKTGFASRVSV